MSNALFDEMARRLDLDKEEEEDDTLEPFKDPLFNELAERMGRLPKGTGRREKMRAKSAEVGPAPPKETAAQKREKRAMTSMTLPTPEERKELDEGGMRAQAQDALRRTVGLPPRAAQKYGQKKAQEMIDKAKPDGGQQAETWRTGPTGHLAERAAISMAPGPEGAAPPEEKGVRERLMSAAASNISGLAQSAAGAMGGFANLEPEEVAGGPWGGLAGPIAAVLEPFQRGIANGMLKPTEATAQFLEEALGLDPQNSFEKRFKENPFLAGAEAGLSNIHSFAATLAASAAGAAIAGPAGMMMGGLGAAGGQAYGNAYQGAKQAGFDETTSQQVAILSSLGEMGLEYFPAAKLLKIAKTPAARAGLARVAGAAMQQATFEFGTEITQESWNIVVEAMASLDEQGIQWEQFGQNLPPDAFWRVAEAGIAGAMLGGTAGGVGGVVAPEMREEGPPPEAGQLALPPGPSPSSLGLPPGPPPRALLTEGMQLPPQGRPAGPSDQGPAGLLPRAIASQAPDPMSMLQPELPDTIPPAQGGPGAIDQLGTAVGPPWDPGLTVPPTPEPPPPPGPKKAYKAPAVLVATAMPPKRPIPPSDPLTLGLGPQRVPGEPVISAIDALTPAQRTDYPELEDDLGDPLDALDQLSPENRPTETLDTAIGPPWDPDLTLEDLVQETPFNVLSGVPEKRMPPYVYVPMDVNDPEDIAGRVWYHGAGPGFSDLGEADPLRVGDYAALIGAGLHLTDSQELGETYRELRAKQQAWDIAVKEMREAGMSGEELLEGPGQEALLKRVNEIQKELGAVLAGKLPGTIRLVDMEQRLDDEAYAAFQEYYEGLDWKVAGQTQLPREATGMDLFNMLHQATTMELSRKKPDFDEIMDNLAPLTLKLQGLLMNRGYHGYKHEGGNLIGGGQQNHNVVILWGDPWQRFGKLAGGVDAKRGTMRQPADPWGRPGRGGPAGGRPGPTPVPEAPPAAEAPVEEAPVEPEAAPKKKPKPAEPEEIVDLTHPLSGRPLEEVELPDIDSANGEVDSAQDELGNSWSYLWAVVDLGDVVPSHDEETRKANPFYDQKLQRRGRGRVTSENQVEAISKDPRGFFDDGSRIGQGAPILNKQGQVLDGNGRVMGLLRKLRLGTYEEFSDQVRAKAADYGITIPEDMENPVLVRIAETTDPAEQSELARVANIGQGAAMAAAEKGMQDAELLTAEDLALYDPELQEGLLAAGNKDFVTAFMSHIPQTEHGAMLTSEANLSKEGLTRIKNAVMARAFPDSDLLELLQESEDNEIRNIGRAFEAAGAPMAQMAAAIEEGSLQDVPIAEEATNAAIKLRDLRKAEQKVPDYLATAQIGDRELSSDEESLLTLFDKWRNAPNKVADFLKAYAAELRDEGDPGQATLTPRPKPTRAELIDRAAERMGAQKSLLEAPTPPKKVPSKKDRLKQELAERRAKKTQKKAEPEAEAKAAPKMRDDKAQARGKAIADTHRAAWGEPDPSKAALSIVGCCKAKGKVRTKAAELYKSALYKLSRKWAERGGRTMVIASAQHGLVPSDREIDPYDTALKAKADKERYAAKVRSDVAFMLEKYPNLTEVEILAGEAYAVPLRAELEKHGIAVTEPLKGLAVGQRLKWLRSPPKAKSPDEAMADDAIEAIEAAKTKPAKEGAEATENLKRERAAMKARTDKEKKAKAKAAKPRANKVLKRWLGGALGQSVADMLGSLHIPGVGLYNTLVKIGFPVNDLEIETDEKGQVKISLAGEYAGFVSKQDRGMIKVEVAMIARRWALENQAEEEVAPEAETEPIPEPDEFELTGEPVAEEEAAPKKKRLYPKIGRAAILGVLKDQEGTWVDSGTLLAALKKEGITLSPGELTSLADEIRDDLQGGTLNRRTQGKRESYQFTSPPKPKGKQGGFLQLPKIFSKASREARKERRGRKPKAKGKPYKPDPPPQSKEAFGAAHQPLGESAWDAIKRLTLEGKQSTTREYRFLPRRVKKWVMARQGFNQIQTARELATEDVNRAIKKILKPLRGIQYELFSEKMLLDSARAIQDINDRAAERATAFEPIGLPMELTPEDLYGPGSWGAEIDAAYADDRAVHEAVLQAKSLYAGVREELVSALEAAGLYDRARQITRYGDDYMHHHVILEEQGLKDHVAFKGENLEHPGGKGFYKKRRGTHTDAPVSLRWATVQSRTMRDMLVDAEIARQLLIFKENYDEMGRLKAKADEQFKAWVERYAKPKIAEHKRDLEDKAAVKLPADQKPRYGVRRKMFETEDLMPLPKDAREDVDYKVRRFARRLYGKGREKYNWRTVGEEEGIWKTHSTWSPTTRVPMNDVFTVSWRLATELLMRDLTEQGDIPMEIWPSDVSQKKIPGRPELWVIPNELKAQLHEQSKLLSLKAYRGVTKGVGAWKVWALFNPKGVIRYLKRNLAGDSIKSYTWNPHGTLFIGKASGDLWTYIRGGEASEALRDWLRLGGARATIFTQELGQMEVEFLYQQHQDNAPKEMAERIKDWKRHPLRTGMRWSGISPFIKKAGKVAFFLEALTRYAQYLSYLQQIKANKGQPNKMTGMGGSYAEEIDGLDSPELKAYWMSNELVGAYDQISVAGQRARESLVPFLSFQEANARTYFRILRNLMNDSGMVDVAGGRYVKGWKKLKQNHPYVAWQTARGMMLTMGWYAGLQAINHLFFPDEEEDLPEEVRRTMHLIYGRNADGSVRYFHRIGTFNEAMNWLPGVGSWTVWADVMDGTIDMQTAMGRHWDIYKDQMWNSLGPTVKIPAELLLTISTYPSISNYRLADSTWQLAMRNAQLGYVYDWLSNRYVPGASGEGPWDAQTIEAHMRKLTRNLFWYEFADERAAYYKAHDIVNDFSDHKDISRRGQHERTKASRAIQNAREAALYGEVDAAWAYWTEYVMAKWETGRTPKQIVSDAKLSLRKLDPLSNLPKRYHDEFYAWMPEGTRDEFERGRDYWRLLLMNVEEIELEVEGRKLRGLAPKGE